MEAQYRFILWFLVFLFIPLAPCKAWVQICGKKGKGKGKGRESFAGSVGEALQRLSSCFFFILKSFNWIFIGLGRYTVTPINSCLSQNKLQSYEVT